MRGNSIHKGFTLAEVLVTLGIIGVVSAMTIPSLTQNWQKKAYVTQLHKIYNVFQQAFLEDINENNAINLVEAGFACGYSSELSDFMHSHFKVVKDCGSNPSQCFASQYRGLNGGTRSGNNFSCYSVSIAGGASICIYMSGNSTDSSIGSIYVDTNGPKGPNIGGRDLFRMYIYPDGVLDDYNIPISCRNTSGCAKERRERNFQSWCKNVNDTDGCFGKLLNDNWEMNY